MLVDAIFSSPISIMEKSMDLRMMRQGLLASNIANAETPNYRAIDVDFEATMGKLIEKMERDAPLELKQTDPRHFDIQGASGVVRDLERERIVFTAADHTSIGNDSNSVDLDTQVSRSQQNTLLYSVTAQLLGKKMKGMASLIDSAAKY